MISPLWDNNIYAFNCNYDHFYKYVTLQTTAKFKNVINILNLQQLMQLDHNKVSHFEISSLTLKGFKIILCTSNNTFRTYKLARYKQGLAHSARAAAARPRTTHYWDVHASDTLADLQISIITI